MNKSSRRRSGMPEVCNQSWTYIRHTQYNRCCVSDGYRVKYYRKQQLNVQNRFVIDIQRQARA